MEDSKSRMGTHLYVHYYLWDIGALCLVGFYLMYLNRLNYLCLHLYILWNENETENDCLIQKLSYVFVEHTPFLHSDL